jgi:hypothetical protein
LSGPDGGDDRPPQSGCPPQPTEVDGKCVPASHDSARDSSRCSASCGENSRGSSSIRKSGRPLSSHASSPRGSPGGTASSRRPVTCERGGGGLTERARSSQSGRAGTDVRGAARCGPRHVHAERRKGEVHTADRRVRLSTCIRLMSIDAMSSCGFGARLTWPGATSHAGAGKGGRTQSADGRRGGGA